ncbi:Trafficking protein particle complex subunit 2 [Wickerhamomyces ciferrii]|uniref:Trafficking protein particle complex subunit 2 n=1 Tax=Wickerhamomyces ciferrii (strain ATCC 14091 / BCRC 22168 / CBS 111 / JCM 3599 / NBRC 0793 / NRRL Y-1031 F-60-10) TaxID=1206466 RepID=K0KQR6_WICCF|nr:Trafficking protein particle complex subunit 2 [Wickerhamomyces ciferrii]CCH43608.1 Trafficking protein particle complex subunit 2 [Wickerhamomyces ciferrii]
MKELNPFILHSSLDIVEDIQWKTSQLYLKTIDNFYGYYISGFLTSGNIKFLLIHETKNEESIRQFFNDLNDLYVKVLLNPFYKVNDAITSPVFDLKVKGFAKKYL